MFCFTWTKWVNCFSFCINLNNHVDFQILKGHFPRTSLYLLMTKACPPWIHSKLRISFERDKECEYGWTVQMVFWKNEHWRIEPWDQNISSILQWEWQIRNRKSWAKECLWFFGITFFQKHLAKLESWIMTVVYYVVVYMLFTDSYLWIMFLILIYTNFWPIRNKCKGREEHKPSFVFFASVCSHNNRTLFSLRLFNVNPSMWCACTNTNIHFANSINVFSFVEFSVHV